MKKLVVSIISIFLSVALVGCLHHHDEEHEHEHEHEVNLQLTSYSEHWEVYAEAHPLVVGEVSEVLAHFTRLADFKPREKGAVTAVLTVGGQTVRQTLENPDRPGIYEFKLTPKAEGKGRLVFLVDEDTIRIENLVAYKDEHTAIHEAEEHHIHGSNAATFTKEQSWKVDFATEPCRVEAFGQVIKTVAQIMPSQGDEQVVVAKSSGIVLMSGKAVVPGVAVSRGQRLFSVESGSMVDDNLAVRFQEVSAEYERTKSEYERKQQLAQDKIVSQSELQRAKAEYHLAAANYNNLKDNFSGGSTVATAPMSGFVKQLMVKQGEYVTAGQPVAVISQNKNLNIKAEVSPKYYPLLAHIVTANFKKSGDEHVYSLEELKGKVLSYGKSADLQNPLVPVVFEVANMVDFLPGTFVEIYIRTQSENEVVTVANAALIEEMGNFFVYVQLTPELFEKREVRIGTTDGQRTEITSGLKGTERVVSKGAILVKLAQASGKLDAHSGHHH